VAALRDRLGGRELALVFDKALSYGYEGPICSDLRGSLLGVEGAPAVFGAVCGLGGRDISPEQLTDSARRATADLRAGARTRATEWINLHTEAE
jgi:pyruvate/2-oxoacid:ferredoxin oxidoreductase alpha subunit